MANVDTNNILDSLVFGNTSGHDGESYWAGVMNTIKNGKLNARNKNAAVNYFASNILYELPDLLQPEGIGTLKRAVELLAIQLDTGLANHFIDKQALLVSAVLAYNPDLKCEIETIQNATAIPKIAMFIKLNNLLSKA